MERLNWWVVSIALVFFGAMILGTGIGTSNLRYYLGGVALVALGFWIKHRKLEDA